MADSKPPKPSDSPPPPQDPFQRFSQPWPRSEKEEDNPFIQFRRYADQSFDSLFSGVSQLCQLANSTPENFEKQLDDWIEKIAKNTKMEEGMRKAMEQDMEEAKQAMKKSPTDLWWTRGNTTKCPALSDLSPRSSKCPALFDSAGPKTELDAYNQIDTSPYNWNSGLGWDGKVKKSQEQSYEQAIRSMTESADHAHKHRRFNAQEQVPDPPLWPHEGARVYTLRSARWMDPFTTPCNTIPWLILSDYSPVFLCNSQQPVASFVRFASGVDHPFSMKVLHQGGPSPFTTHIDEKMERALPWADAFEDLISLEKTGKMVDRDASTFKTPRTWIHDMVMRGSLGPAWGFNDQGLLTQKEELYDKDFVNSPPGRRRRWEIENAGKIVDAIKQQTAQQAAEAGAEKLGDQIRTPVSAGGKEHELPRIDSTYDLENRPRRSQRHTRHTPTVHISLDDVLRQTNDAGGESAAVEVETKAADQILRSGFASLTAALPTIIFSGQSELGESISSSKTWSEHGTGKGESTVISTMTKTETTTLPDGSVQTKRVLNRRFADGREENEESVDTRPHRGIIEQVQRRKRDEPSRSIARMVDTSEETAIEPKLQPTPRKSGWFWT